MTTALTIAALLAGFGIHISSARIPEKAGRPTRFRLAVFTLGLVMGPAVIIVSAQP